MPLENHWQLRADGNDRGSRWRAYTQAGIEMINSKQSFKDGEPKDAWKTDLLAIVLIFAFAIVAVITFLR
jgi:hypothetical protein